MVQEREVQRVKATQNISYRDAVARVAPTLDRNNNSSSPPLRKPTQSTASASFVQSTSPCPCSTKIMCNVSTQTFPEAAASSSATSSLSPMFCFNEEKLAACLLDILSRVRPVDSLPKRTSVIANAFKTYFDKQINSTVLANSVKDNLSVVPQSPLISFGRKPKPTKSNG
jgi:hypothetical protein